MATLDTNLDHGSIVPPGGFVMLDGKTIGETLLPGDAFSDSGYPGCSARYPIFGCGPIKSVAVNVTVTGKSYRRLRGSYWLRCRIEWVGDCEPSTFAKGWVLCF